MNKINEVFIFFISLLIILMFIALRLEIDNKNEVITELKQDLYQSKSYSRELQNFIEMQNYLELDKK